jgi:two-component system cell cycle sensor histidine kinase/response regulator CckA
VAQQYSCGTVIVADDNPFIRELIQCTLSDIGYTVLSAGDGFEAMRIAMFMIGQPDILITDIEMPNMDGIKLARALRELVPCLPVLFISGKHPSEELSLYLLEPDTRFLSKPFYVAELQLHVESLAAAEGGRRGDLSSGCADIRAGLCNDVVYGLAMSKPEG